MARTLRQTLNAWSLRTLDRLWEIERHSQTAARVLFRIAVYTHTRTHEKTAPATNPKVSRGGRQPSR